MACITLYDTSRGLNGDEARYRLAPWHRDGHVTGPHNSFDNYASVTTWVLVSQFKPGENASNNRNGEHIVITSR